MTFFTIQPSFFCDNLPGLKAPYRAVLWFRRNHSPEEKLGNAIYGGRVLFAVRKVVMHSPPLR